MKLKDRQLYRKISDAFFNYMVYGGKEEEKQKLKSCIMQIGETHSDLFLYQEPIKNYNIGMMAVICGFEDIVKMALNNKKACTQQDILGYNIGMLLLEKGNYNLAAIAYKNKDARKQLNFWKDNMDSIAKKKGINLEDFEDEQDIL